MPPDTLVYVPFTPDMLDAVRGFNYGDEPHQQELAFWLLNDSIPAMTRGTNIWLYRNQAGDFIGYPMFDICFAAPWKNPGEKID